MTENQAVIELASHPTEEPRRIPANLANALEDTGADRYKATPYTIDNPNKIIVTLIMPKRLGGGSVSHEIVDVKKGTFA